MRQSSPTVVSPPPPLVPREMVTYSRMVLSSPMRAAGGFAGVLEVLRGYAEAGEGEELLLRPMRQVAVENDVGDEFAVFSEDDVGADGAVGTDRAACGDLRAGARRSLWGGCSLGGLEALPSVGVGSSGAWDDLAHDGGVADEFAVDCTTPPIFTASGAPVEDCDFDAELVAGCDGACGSGRFRCW